VNKVEAIRENNLKLSSKIKHLFAMIATVKRADLIRENNSKFRDNNSTYIKGTVPRKSVRVFDFNI
jgi:hypothetical protein